MLCIFSVSYPFVSLNWKVLKIKDEQTYNVVYLSFVDELQYVEVTTHNIVKANI